MAGKKLAAYVHVGGEVYKPGDTPPKDVAEEITNPLAWGKDADDDTETADGPPPLSGKGSGKGAWADYAETFDPPVEVEADATRDDIVDAIRAAGHPVE
jgi:hypothetical protein